MTNEQPNKYTLEFTGTSIEFFKIWIVNVMLSILTLGIYSAWAKVRTKRYFYNNTLLMGATFDYLASPLKILKGRLIAFALFAVYSFTSTGFPMIHGVLMIALGFLFPWAFIKSLGFNSYNTAYRNIRFNFHATYAMACDVFIKLPMVILLTLGLGYPYFIHRQKKFIINNSGYGKQHFELKTSNKDFYIIYGKFFGMVLLMFIAMVSYQYLIKTFLSDLPKAVVVLITVLFFFLFLIMPLLTYLSAAVTNIVFNNTTLGEHRLQSCLENEMLYWLYVSNTFAIIFSCGLLIPWAMIRTTRYRLSCLSIYIENTIDDFNAAETENNEALGEEIGDVFNFDIGL